MLTATILALLCTAPVKIAATGFTESGGGDPARANVWLERFAEVMRRDGKVQVSTSNDIAQLMGIERQKELFGCAADGSSCIAELANALGAEGVLVGTFTRSKDAYLVVLRVLRQPSGAVWWSASSRVTGETALLDWLDEQATACANALAPSAPATRAPLVLGGVGLGVALAGAGLLAVAHTVALGDVRTAANEPALRSALTAGRSESTAGVVLVSVGAAAVAAAIVWKLVGQPAAAVAISATPSGTFVSVGGSW